MLRNRVPFSLSLGLATRNVSVQYVFIHIPILLETKITGLQDELTKSGVLKNMSDHEDFWKLVQEEALGEEIKERLQKIRFKCLYISFLSTLGIFVTFSR